MLPQPSLRLLPRPWQVLNAVETLVVLKHIWVPSKSLFLDGNDWGSERRGTSSYGVCVLSNREIAVMWSVHDVHRGLRLWIRTWHVTMVWADCAQAQRSASKD